MGTILYYIMFGALPPLDSLGRPVWAFGKRIHDLCERRAHYDASEFVEEWGDEGARKGWCLYKMGCKGPYTYGNCPKVRYNEMISWPVMAGHGCIGCFEPGFLGHYGPARKAAARSRGCRGRHDRRPDRARSYRVTAAGIAAHAIASSVRHRRELDKLPEEKKRTRHMANRIIVDPITRIEGHLRIEVEVDGSNTVRDAWSSITLWRGMEVILKGRDPRDAGLYIQRFCGVCTLVHYEASILACENAFGVTPPPNARIIRNLMAGAWYLGDHIMHFYHLHGLDWVDVVSALTADPGKGRGPGEAIQPEPLQLLGEPLPGSPAAAYKIRQIGEARAFCQCVLGEPLVQAAARGQPGDPFALSRRAARIPALRPDAGHLRGKEPAPADPRRRRGDKHHGPAWTRCASGSSCTV